MAYDIAKGAQVKRYTSQLKMLCVACFWPFSLEGPEDIFSFLVVSLGSSVYANSPLFEDFLMHRVFARSRREVCYVPSRRSKIGAFFTMAF